MLCGTNDLNTNKSPHEIISDIMKLALELKHPSTGIMMWNSTAYGQIQRQRYTGKQCFKV